MFLSIKHNFIWTLIFGFTYMTHTQLTLVHNRCKKLTKTTKITKLTKTHIVEFCGTDMRRLALV